MPATRLGWVILAPRPGAVPVPAAVAAVDLRPGHRPGLHPTEPHLALTTRRALTPPTDPTHTELRSIPTKKKTRGSHVSTFFRSSWLTFPICGSTFGVKATSATVTEHCRSMSALPWG